MSYALKLKVGYIKCCTGDETGFHLNVNFDFMLLESSLLLSLLQKLHCRISFMQNMGSCELFGL